MNWDMCSCGGVSSVSPLPKAGSLGPCDSLAESRSHVARCSKGQQAFEALAFLASRTENKVLATVEQRPLWWSEVPCVGAVPSHRQGLALCGAPGPRLAHNGPMPFVPLAEPSVCSQAGESSPVRREHFRQSCRWLAILIDAVHGGSPSR